MARCHPPWARRLRARVARLGAVTCASGPMLALASAAAAQEGPPPDLKVAFIGDQGDSTPAIRVLELIAAEGARAIVHNGDFDYGDSPPVWDAINTSIFGPEFPYFASAGNHDKSRWYTAGGYQTFMHERMVRLGIPWSGDLGVRSTFTWMGIHFVMTAPGIFGGGDGLHDVYIRDEFASSPAAWRISSFHKNQHLMQAGGKNDETGWGVYEESRRAGALVSTGHEHSYSRTHLLSSMQQQTVASTAEPLVLTTDDPATTPDDEGRSFAYVVGTGGRGLRDQEVFGDWFASVYTTTQGAKHGALFGVFHVNGDSRLAHFYFKNVDGNVIDEFMVRSRVGCGDQDGDGICDERDVCSADPDPGQLDSDLDGYGNACDPDYDGNGVVGSSDLQALTVRLLCRFPDPAYDPIYDADGDAVIGPSEMAMLFRHFGREPGPSGLACAGSRPCSACDAPDADGDGVCDPLDDCVALADPQQIDSDLDGYGNACDPDYTNDGVVGAADLALVLGAFGRRGPAPPYLPAIDANSDGVIGGHDLAPMGGRFGGAPGPSGYDCAGALPCLFP